MFKKEVREIKKKMQKTRMKTFFRKERGNLFALEKISVQEKGGEKHFLFFQKKKGKVDPKNTFFQRKGLKEHIFFVFFLVFFFFTKKN